MAGRLAAAALVGRLGLACATAPDTTTTATSGAAMMMAAAAARRASSSSSAGSTRATPLGWRMLAYFGKGCALVYAITHHVGFPSLVTGPSMFPAFASSGEVVLAECLPGMHGRVRRGDVVICVRPVDASEHVVKRVAAVAGERVAVLPPARGGRAWAGPWAPPMPCASERGGAKTGGGEKRGGGGAAGGGADKGVASAPPPAESASSSFAGAAAGAAGGGGLRRLVVPPGHVWIAGDNMVVSRDSREYGPVPLGTVRGRVVCTVWPRPRRVDGGAAVLGGGGGGGGGAGGGGGGRG